MSDQNMWCCECGTEFVGNGDCPFCGSNVSVPKEGAVLCSNQEEPHPCTRPAVDPARDLHMCNNCGDAYIHGF